ncbi:MAG TPA: hypothetical protein VGK67_22080 [Myxococcales bacterium]|jgi:hypothetical protein
MHNYDPYAIALIAVAIAAIPPSLVLPFISVFAVRAKLSLIFATYLGVCGFLALGIAQLGRAIVGPTVHRSDYYGTLVFALAIAIPAFGAACLMLGRAFTEKRVWKVIGSAFLLGLGANVALGCLAIHQFILADHYRNSSESGWIFGALFGGIPIAIVGLVLLALSSAKAAKAEGAAAESTKPAAPAAAPAAG